MADTLDDETTLGGRLKRYTQVSTALGGLAARVLGERAFGIAIDRETHASNLKTVLGNLKGPLMKVAQFLATVPDAIPPEYVADLMELQANAPAMGWAFVKRRMTTELGPDWQSKFASFEPTASAAASLGQVHKARDHEGRALACKLQYPDMQSAIEADLAQLKLILSIYETWDKALETADVQQEIATLLQEELDYIHEAKNLSRYQTIFKDHSQIHVPTVYPTLSSKRLLTMDWLEGQSLLDKINSPVEERNAIAERMFMAWYLPFYHYGLIHGDPHPGNYTVRPDGGINLLDFGCVRVFNPNFVKGVIDLYHALLHRNWDLARQAYENWGFTGLTKELIEVINQWALLLYGPLLEDRVRPIQEAHSGVLGREIASKVHEELRRAGGIRPPREFVFMDRAAVGLGSVFMRLKAELNWHQLFEELIDDFSVETLAERQENLIKSN